MKKHRRAMKLVRSVIVPAAKMHSDPDLANFVEQKVRDGNTHAGRVLMLIAILRMAPSFPGSARCVG